MSVFVCPGMYFNLAFMGLDAPIYLCKNICYNNQKINI
jgi:hypothetical protein